MRARWMIITAASAILATACDSRTSWPDRGRGRRPGAPPAQPTGDLAQPLATVDGVTITVGEFQDRLNRQSPYIRNRYTSFEQKARTSTAWCGSRSWPPRPRAEASTPTPRSCGR